MYSNVRDISSAETLELFKAFIVSNKELSLYDDRYTVELYNSTGQTIRLVYRESELELGNSIKLEFIPRVENLRLDGYLKLDNELVIKLNGYIKHCISKVALDYLKN